LALNRLRYAQGPPLQNTSLYVLDAASRPGYAERMDFGFDHVHLVASDLDASERFYRESLLLNLTPCCCAPLKSAIVRTCSGPPPSSDELGEDVGAGHVERRVDTVRHERAKRGAAAFFGHRLLPSHCEHRTNMRNTRCT
jgi:hypothetical protein